MTTKISIRDLARQSETISRYDYVEIENKKTKKYHGIFISAKYAKEMKKILDEKIAQEKKKKLDTLESFSGMLSGQIGDQKTGEIKAKFAK
jgi:hypothetical protein